jgi:hypothetical protein
LTVLKHIAQPPRASLNHPGQQWNGEHPPDKTSRMALAIALS